MTFDVVVEVSQGPDVSGPVILGDVTAPSMHTAMAMAVELYGRTGRIIELRPCEKRNALLAIDEERAVAKRAQIRKARLAAEAAAKAAIEAEYLARKQKEKANGKRKPRVSGRAKPKRKGRSRNGKADRVRLAGRGDRGDGLVDSSASRDRCQNLITLETRILHYLCTMPAIRATHTEITIALFTQRRREESVWLALKCLQDHSRVDYCPDSGGWQIDESGAFG